MHKNQDDVQNSTAACPKWPFCPSYKVFIFEVPDNLQILRDNMRNAFKNWKYWFPANWEFLSSDWAFA